MLGNLRIKLNTAPSIIILSKLLKSKRSSSRTLKSQELNFIAMREKLRRFMKAIESCTEEATFIPEVWNDTVERTVVNEDNTVCFELKNGEKVTATL